MGQGPALTRRELLAGALAASAAGGCSRPAEVPGGFAGISHERGHRLRPSAPGGSALAATASSAAPSAPLRTRVLIAGGGVAGLAAARALGLRGMDDLCLLELEDAAGGNSRSGRIEGLACPLGAHYLPLPGDDAHEVQDLLEELGLRRRVAGRWQWDERHLCHSPQERLYQDGEWHEGLLPVHGALPATLAQYERFAACVTSARQAARFAIPAWRAPASALHATLRAQSFAAWLAHNGLDDPWLRWYLDYCCRDDYGVGAAGVSAWAGLHYFASRHGFAAPGTETAEREGLLTWPEGNAWLTQRLAKPLGERLRTGRVVMRIAATRAGVEVDAYDVAGGRTERWRAERCIIALPLHVAARVVEGAPDFLRAAASRVRHAPWVVTNIHLREPLRDRPGAAPSWDNVLFGSTGLGYVDATHQRLDPRPGPTVLTCYRALGDEPQGRQRLLDRPWTHWRDMTLAELAGPHPDLAGKATRVEVTRYGHAMAIPAPGIAPQRPPVAGPLQFAHSDWAGYSIFEEAFTLGHLAGTNAV
jgi:monoamine oxidase